MAPQATTAQKIYELLEGDVYKGDLVRFSTSGWSPKSWYLVRHSYRSHVPDPEFVWDLGSNQWIGLLGKRGGEYVITWDEQWPGPEYSVWLNYLNSSGTGIESRTSLTGLEVMPSSEAEAEDPNYLSTYLPDQRQVEAWPDI